MLTEAALSVDQVLALLIVCSAGAGARLAVAAGVASAGADTAAAGRNPATAAGSGGGCRRWGPFARGPVREVQDGDGGAVHEVSAGNPGSRLECWGHRQSGADAGNGGGAGLEIGLEGQPLFLSSIALEVCVPAMGFVMWKTVGYTWGYGPGDYDAVVASVGHDRGLHAIWPDVLVPLHHVWVCVSR